MSRCVWARRGRPGIGTVPGATVATDPYWANVVLLALNENGADGTTVFDDTSNSNHTLTGAGNAQWDTDQAPPGLTSSLRLDGTGDLISTPDSADWDLPGDFAVDLRLRLSALPVNSWTNLLGCYQNASTGWGIQYRNDLGGGNRLTMFTSGDVPLVNFAWTAAVATWYDIAITRSSNTLRAFINGSQIGTDQANSESLTTGAAFQIGGPGGTFTNNLVNGWMASVRITKGVARYTENFTPPSLPLPTS